MRILFTFIGGIGHFNPLVSVARAAEAKGHIIAFGCEPIMVPTVQKAGFTALPFGESKPFTPQKRPLRPVDVAREAQEFRDRFGRDGTDRRLPFTTALCRDWQPDILVCDETDFGSMMAAECLDIPYAVVLVMAAGSFVRPELIGETLNEIRVKHGLPPDPKMVMLHRFLALSPFPPLFRDPAYPLPQTGFSFRPEAEQADAEIPPWLANLPSLPMVYFSLGTIFNLESGDLFMRVLSGLRTLPINVIVTVGPYFDPQELGPQPENVVVESYIDQDLILPYCSLIVSHGGSGSVSGALQYGKPSVLIPMGADQPLNAARCQQLGIAEVLDPIRTTPESVRAAALEVMSNPTYRRIANKLSDEFRTLPDPTSTVPLLEQLVEEKRPFIP